MVNLNQVVTDVSKMLGRLIGENIDWCCRLAPDLGNITADPGQLQQIVMNLAVNSRDAMPNGGTLMIETSQCRISMRPTPADHPGARSGHHVMLAVTDYGARHDA